MFGWLVEHYNDDTHKFHTTYGTTKFTRALEREVIRAVW